MSLKSLIKNILSMAQPKRIVNANFTFKNEKRIWQIKSFLLLEVVAVSVLP